MQPDEIRQALAAWKRSSDTRDTLVRLAHQAGIPVMEIHQLSGIARTTIYAILGDRIHEDRAG